MGVASKETKFRVRSGIEIKRVGCSMVTLFISLQLMVLVDVAVFKRAVTHVLDQTAANVLFW